jgi:hypothetical protein
VGEQHGLVKGASIMSELQEKIKALSIEIDQAQADADRLALEAKMAQEKLDYLKRYKVPEFFEYMGIKELGLESGRHVEIKAKATCSPNKNTQDKMKLALWLKEHNASHIVKEEVIVPIEELDKIEDLGIHHRVEQEVNTMSLKAWIKGALGSETEVAQIKQEDIPDYVHYWSWNEAVITD